MRRTYALAILLVASAILSSCGGEGDTRLPKRHNVSIENRPMSEGLTISAVKVNGVTAPVKTNTFSRIVSLLVEFNHSVTVDHGAFILTNGTHTLSNGFEGAITVSGEASQILTLKFQEPYASGIDFGSLADGIWTLETDLTKAMMVDGPMKEFGIGVSRYGDIRRLYGDLNGDGVVNNADFELFSKIFGMTGDRCESGQLDPNIGLGDFDNNCVINSDDFDQFGNRFGLFL